MTKIYNKDRAELIRKLTRELLTDGQVEILVRTMLTDEQLDHRFYIAGAKVSIRDLLQMEEA